MAFASILQMSTEITLSTSNRWKWFRRVKKRVGEVAQYDYLTALSNLQVTSTQNKLRRHNPCSFRICQSNQITPNRQIKTKIIRTLCSRKDSNVLGGTRSDERQLQKAVPPSYTLKNREEIRKIKCMGLETLVSNSPHQKRKQQKKNPNCFEGHCSFE